MTFDESVVMEKQQHSHVPTVLQCGPIHSPNETMVLP